MKFCTNCGAQIPEGSKFCPNCGSSVPVTEEPVRSSDSGQQEKQNTNGYQTYQQGPVYTGTVGYRANIRKRDIAIAVILSLVTCGIYGLIWFINIITDLNTAAQTPEDKSAGMIILLSIVTCGIYGYIWLYRAGEKVDKIREMNGEAPQSSSLLYLLLCIFGLSIVVYCLIQSELNKVATLA